MGSFRRGIRFFRSQEVVYESRLSSLRKMYPIKKNIVELMILIFQINFMFTWFIGLLHFQPQFLETISSSWRVGKAAEDL